MIEPQSPEEEQLQREVMLQEQARVQAQQQFNMPQPSLYRENISDTSFVALTDPLKTLDYIEHIYRGDYMDADGNWKVDKQDILKKMNEKGLRTFITLIGSLVREAPYSFLEDEEINWACKELGRSILFEIVTNYEEYEIKKSNAKSIINVAINLSWVTLKRAKHAKTLTTLGTVRQEHVTSGMGMNPQQKKKSLLWGLVKW